MPIVLGSGETKVRQVSAVMDFPNMQGSKRVDQGSQSVVPGLTV